MISSGLGHGWILHTTWLTGVQEAEEECEGSDDEVVEPEEGHPLLLRPLPSDTAMEAAAEPEVLGASEEAPARLNEAARLEEATEVPKESEAIVHQLSSS